MNRKTLGVLAAVMAAGVSLPVFAESTLPNIGVDVSGYVTSMGTTLGGVLAVVIGVGVAIFIAKKGYRLVKGV